MLLIAGVDSNIAQTPQIIAIIIVILLRPSSAPFWLPKISDGEPIPPIPIVFAGCNNILRIKAIEEANWIINNKVFKLNHLHN
jgi:hypothetical protein